MSSELESGIYNLIIYLDKDCNIEVGSLGEFNFERGYYIYTGTAQRNLSARIDRHKSQDKKLHWHIDYLLQKAEIVDVETWPKNKEAECQIHQELASKPEFVEPIAGFGASDCSCRTHLLYSFQRPKIEDKLAIGN
ncbi:GIY-YIG nuclease family protein [Sporohalobacter salinus]|uniref:GIY-YIG nuclease family protein n=1 Tax=Sporohalobacter salinus TaxID=1494606 RepID=UPI00195F740E|nr:GIY-YIG nuclease family protein [Sporohalobacter salinus]MBM7624190.1 sugar fermentation stimulation protein A [Sporohalobacter salinus]